MPENLATPGFSELCDVSGPTLFILVAGDTVQEASTMTSAGDPYASLADLYDAETSDAAVQAFYDEWRDSLLKAVRQNEVPVRVLIDLACGTGNTTVPWTRQHGWTVVGVDRSAAMLRQARKKSRRVRWYRQDLTRLDLKERADVVTCHFDALDHILVPKDLERVFVRVARIMNEGGLFQFDMNTEHWFRWLRVHEKLFRVGPHFFMAYNEYDPKRRIATFHQLWFVKRGGTYRKREVVVQERSYCTAEIRRMIKKAGLRLLKLKIQSKLEGRPIRMLYLARKSGR
jgi:ubiquinone/menaquinone biosynthesis C-methylase UbiE